MAEKTFYGQDITLTSSWEVYVSSNPPHEYLATSASYDYGYVNIDYSEVLKGSTIHSATLYGTGFYGATHTLSVDGGSNRPYDGDAIDYTATARAQVANASASQSVSLYYRYKAYNSTSGGLGYNSDSVTVGGSLKIVYTLPYTSCDPPTTFSFSVNNVAPGATSRLSWSGAKGGTNNAIKEYKVYRATSAGGTYAHLGTTTNAYLNVAAPTTNGSSYFYKVIAVGTVSGYDSGYSVASGGLKCVFTAPSVSNVKLAGSASAVYAETGGSLTLSWDASNGTNNAIQSYSILRNGSAWKTGVTAKTYTVTAHATSGSSYYYTVVPVGAHSNGSGVNSPTVYSYVGCTAPTAVSIASTNVAPGASIRLSWSGAGGGGTYNTITGYQVFRATSASGTYSKIADVTGTATSGNTNVTAPTSNGSSYFYKVLTVGSRKNSGQSSVNAELKCSFTAPSVSNVKLSKQYASSGENVTLSWSASNGTNNAVKSYTVYRGSDVYKAGITSGSYTVPAHATVGSNYQYSVIAIGTHSNSSRINAPVLYTYGNPTAPTTVSVSPGSVDAGTNATLSWSGATAGSHNAITGYHVYRSESSGGTYAYLGAVTTIGTSGSLAVTAHTIMGKTYYYKVYTIGTHSNSAVSGVYGSVSSIVYSQPTVPTTLTIDADEIDAGTKTVIRWSGASGGTNNPITQTLIWRSETDSASPYSSYVHVDTVSGDSGSGSREVTAHSEMGKTYYFKVSTKGTKEGFLWSSHGPLKVSLKSRVYTAVASPTGVSVSSGLLNPDSTVRISWNEAAGGTNTSVSGYEVWKSTNSGSYVLFQSVGAGVLYVEDVLGVSGTTQHYKIKALADRSGYDSGFSAVVLAKSNTPPSAPSSVSASPGLYESGDITVSFPACTDVDGNLSHYQVQRRIQTAASGWGPWTNLNTNLQSTSMVDTPTVERGYRVQYRVKTHDALGLTSAYVESIQVIRNSLPLVPVVVLPSDNAGIFNSRPIVRVRVSAEPDGTAQSLQVSVDDGVYSTLVSVPSGGEVLSVQMPSALLAGVHTIRLRTIDNLGAVSEAITVHVEVLPTGYARVISKGAVIADESISHQAEIEQLYNQVNSIRSYYGFELVDVPPLVGVHANLGAGNIGMFAAWGLQMRQLQLGIAETWAVSGISPVTWLSCNAGMHPRADVIDQIRKQIERA